MRVRAAGCLAFVGVSVLTSMVHAQDSASAAAGQVMYDQATQAMDRKDYAFACPKLEEVVRLVPDGVGARITLGECYEGAGKLASAWSAYMGAEATANRVGQAQRAEKAGKAAETLKQKLATLTIVVTADIVKLAGLTVQRDGIAIKDAAFGIAIPVDAGNHVIAAEASGKQRLEKSAAISRDGEAITVTIDALVDGPSTVGPRVDQGGVSTLAIGSAPVPPLAIAGFVVGGAGIVVGAITGAMTLSKGSPCTSNAGCSSSTLDSAKTTAWVSDIAFGVGIAGAGVGTIVLLTSRSKRSPSAMLHIGPSRLTFEQTF